MKKFIVLKDEIDELRELCRENSDENHKKTQELSLSKKFNSNDGKKLSFYNYI